MLSPGKSCYINGDTTVQLSEHGTGKTLSSLFRFILVPHQSEACPSSAKSETRIPKPETLNPTCSSQVIRDVEQRNVDSPPTPGISPLPASSFCVPRSHTPTRVFFSVLPQNFCFCRVPQAGFTQDTALCCREGGFASFATAQNPPPRLSKNDLDSICLRLGGSMLVLTRMQGCG